MYTYYGLQTLGVRDLWWKKYITQLQIVQFVTSFVCLLATLLYMSVLAGASGSASSESVCNGFSAETYYSIWYNVAFNVTLLYAFLGVAKRTRSTALGKEMPVKKTEE